MQYVHMRLDIGPSPFQCNLNIWDQLAPTLVFSDDLKKKYDYVWKIHDIYSYNNENEKFQP